MTELKYGRLTTIEVYKIKGERTRVLARCDCGITKTYRLEHLKNGETQSCGCLRNERTAKVNKKHGMTKSPEYRCLLKIMERCLDSEYKEYNYYGGRGISVCDRWNNRIGGGFENFLADMGLRPSLKHSIDRIDANGDYEPNNCRWTTDDVQGFNQRIRKDNKSGRCGVRLLKSGKYNAMIGYQSGKVNLGSYSTFEEAVLAREQGELKYHGYIKA